MSVRTTLFKALEAADSTVCNGQRVTSMDTGPGVLLRPYVDLPMERRQYIHDQEILVDDTGRAYTHAIDGKGEPLVWSFQVVRPMRGGRCSHDRRAAAEGRGSCQRSSHEDRA